MMIKKRIISSSIILKVSFILAFLAIAVIIMLYFFSDIIMSVNIDKKLHHFFLLIFIFLVILAFLVAFVLFHHYLKPVKILTEAVNEIKKGNLDKKINITGHDEFGRLAEAFNAMTAELKKMVKAREQLLLDVSHELRTPVTRSKLALEMLPDSKEKFSVIDDIKEMEIMITEILETARMDNNLTLNIKELHVNDLISKTLSSFETEKDRIKVNPVSEKILIQADESRIIIVLRNIIENSLKYSKGDNRQIEISVIDRPETILIQVEDFGLGIPEDKLPFVFEPFYRADDSRSKRTGGYGLGLHLCKRIMDAHHAEINIQNKLSGSGVIVSMSFKANPL